MFTVIQITFHEKRVIGYIFIIKCLHLSFANWTNNLNNGNISIFVKMNQGNLSPDKFIWKWKIWKIIISDIAGGLAGLSGHVVGVIAGASESGS